MIYSYSLPQHHYKFIGIEQLYIHNLVNIGFGLKFWIFIVRKEKKIFNIRDWNLVVFFQV